MKLNLPNRSVAKPITSLQEKTSGHKFSLPTKSKPVETASTTDTPKPKGLQLGGSKLPAKPQPAVKTTNAIPKISDEKFNLVEGAEPSLSNEAAEKFRDMLTMLAETIDDDAELQNVLKGTLMHLQEFPEVDAILTPEDRAVFVRAARKSYGITLVAKTTRKAKTTKNAKQVDDLMDELADLDFSI